MPIGRADWDLSLVIDHLSFALRQFGTFEATFLTLRKPIKIPDLRYTAENMTNQVEIDIPAMPNVENIVIELLRPQVKGLELTPRKIVIEPRQPGTILLSRRDNSGFMWIQIAGDLKPRLQLQSNVMAKYGNQVTAMSSLSLIHI